MTEQLARLKESNLPVICKKCQKEFRGAEVCQHTVDTGHEDYYLKPVSIPKIRRERI
jgi:hypothetical protein